MSTREGAPAENTVQTKVGEKGNSVIYFSAKIETSNQNLIILPLQSEQRVQPFSSFFFFSALALFDFPFPDLGAISFPSCCHRTIGNKSSQNH